MLLIFVHITFFSEPHTTAQGYLFPVFSFLAACLRISVSQKQKESVKKIDRILKNITYIITVRTHKHNCTSKRPSVPALIYLSNFHLNIIISFSSTRSTLLACINSNVSHCKQSSCFIYLFDLIWQ